MLLERSHVNHACRTDCPGIDTTLGLSMVIPGVGTARRLTELHSWGGELTSCGKRQVHGGEVSTFVLGLVLSFSSFSRTARLD